MISLAAPNKRWQRTRHERASLVSCVSERLKRSVRHSIDFYATMKTFQLLVLVLVIWDVAHGQSIDVELVKLREFLKVPASTKIVPSTAPLPRAADLKVFIATGSERDIYQVFDRRIDEWDKKNGAKFGRLEVVSDVSEAQVVLAWYSIRIEKMTHPPDDTPSDERICCPERAYSYLLVRNGEEFAMLSRIIIEGYVLPSSRESSGNTLRAEFFKRMKAR